MHGLTTRLSPKLERLRSFVVAVILSMLAPAGTQATCTSFDGNLEWVGAIGGGYFVESYDVTVSGTTAYLRDHKYGLNIFDISNPTSPVSLGYVGLHGKGYSVAVSGTHVYSGSGSGGTSGYFEVVDVSNPAAPVLQATLSLPGWGVDIKVSGSLAYVTEGAGALRVIDVSNPTAPVIVGNLVIPGGAGHMALSGSIAYVSRATSGIALINVGNPANPFIQGTFQIPGWSDDLAISGTTLYVTNPYDGVNGPPGLHVLDISVPNAPVILGSLVTSNAGSIALSGTVAYVAVRPMVKAIDVSNPTSPAIIDSLGLPQWANGLALSGKIVCIADGNSGLQLIAHCTPEVVNLETSGFTPSAITVSPEWQITWVKIAGGNHTTTNGTGPLDPAAGTLWDGQLRSTSPEFIHVFTSPGTFPYFCRNHPSETGTITVSGAQTGIDEPRPSRFDLAASPNPFRTDVLVKFEVEHDQKVSLVIMDLQGRRVRTLSSGELPPGMHSMNWDGRDDSRHLVGPGLYLARLLAGDGEVKAQKLFKTR